MPIKAPAQRDHRSRVEPSVVSKPALNDRVHPLREVIQCRGGVPGKPPRGNPVAHSGQLVRGHGRLEAGKDLLPSAVIGLAAPKVYPQNVNDTRG